MNTQNLEVRIAAAFEPHTPSADVAVLIADVDGAVCALEQAAVATRAVALEPTIIGDAALVAQGEMNDVAFRLDRMREAKRKLAVRLTEAQEAERQARRWANYDAAAKERDELARELAEVYPGLSVQLAELMARVQRNDDTIDRINSRFLPCGANHLVPAELAARGLHRFSDGLANIPRITAEMRLPKFKYSGQDRYEWPK